MIRGDSVRTLYEACCTPGSGGPAKFVHNIQQSLGLVDRRGNKQFNRVGNQEIIRDPRNAKGEKIPRLDPKEFSIKELAEAIIGPDYEHRMRSGDVQRAFAMGPLIEASTAGGIMASAFADINAWTATVAGLLEISLMEGWENPNFIMSELMPDENTKMYEGRKVIGTSRLGDVSEERQPGNPTKRAQIGERWITQPRTVENSLAVEVYQETVYLDLTGQVLQQASDVGTWLHWRKEIRQIDCFIGITNSYSYKGTGYNTYQSLGYFNNSISNELLHWDQVQNALILFRDMIDPETGLRVLIMPNFMVVNREKLVVAESIVGSLAGDVQYRDAPGSTANPQEIRQFGSPYKGKFQVYESPLIYQRMTDSATPSVTNQNPGLGLSPTAAAKMWFMGQKGKAFKYAQNVPMRTQTAAPNQTELIDRGVVLFTKADERGVPMVYEPRQIVQCTQ